MFSTMYQSYEATRPKTRAEQREIDRANGEFAAAAAGLWRASAAPWHSLRQALRARRGLQPSARLHQSLELTSADIALLMTPREQDEMCRAGR